MAPLRSGIQALRDGTLHDRDMHVYSDVELVSLQCGSRGVLYRVRLRTAANVDWRRTTRLAYGSLLALSHDGFESITWATVASREPSLLVGDTPSVDISFPEVLH